MTTKFKLDGWLSMMIENPLDLTMMFPWRLQVESLEIKDDLARGTAADTRRRNISIKQDIKQEYQSWSQYKGG